MNNCFKPELKKHFTWFLFANKLHSETEYRLTGAGKTTSLDKRRSWQSACLKNASSVQKKHNLTHYLHTLLSFRTAPQSHHESNEKAPCQ